MNKFFLSIIATFLIVPLAYSAYEVSTRVTVQDFDDIHNNLVINYQGEKWLLHHKAACDFVDKGDSIVLSVRGNLDESGDSFSEGNYHSCAIDQAEPFNATLTVDFVSTSNTTTLVRDENGRQWRIYYSQDCRAMKGLNGKTVYLRQFSYQLSEGDVLILPSGDNDCVISFVQSREIEEKVEVVVEQDVKRPTAPTGLRAIPGKTGVYLYWNDSKDNVGIDHYMISYAQHRVLQDVADWELSAMPNLTRTQTNRSAYKITELDPDEFYFFHVAAVDNAGNISSEWSQVATALTRSSIFSPNLRIAGPLIRMTQQTDRSFLFRWNDVPGDKHGYTVILEMDGQREFSSNSWQQSYIRILKKSRRRNQDLKLIVRAFDARGNLLQDTFKFSF